MEGSGKVAKSRMFVTNVLQPKDELEDKLEKCYGIVTGATTQMSENEAHDALNKIVCQGAQQQEEVSLGLLYTILVEPQAAAKAYRDLTYIARDGLGLVAGRVIGLVTDKYSKLLESARTQILWLTAELVNSSVMSTDGLCHALIRQVAGGDMSPSNLWLAENLLAIFSNNRPWLEKNPVLLATAVYTYLRLIEDHENPTLKNLRQMEIDFCCSLLKERFADCMQIGRDLVRLLHNVARIPEFSAIWKDILQKPQTLCPQFSGISQLLYLRTSRKFLACRLTPEMENRILFLTSKVKFGQQRRYQDWFYRHYLSSPENQTLIPDLIRYIVGVVHPSNEVLCSDIIPRWAIIGWLLTSAQVPVVAVNSKLALFYDWLLYQSDKDNIMNIEPAVLLMYHSIRSHVAITHSLLDFLCRIIPNYCIPLKVEIRKGVTNAFRSITEKKVITSLAPLLDNPKMGRNLKILIRNTLPEFCTSGGKLEESSPSAFSKVDHASTSLPDLPGGTDNEMAGTDSINRTSETADSGVDEELDIAEEEAVFSDPEEDEEKQRDYSFKPIDKEAMEEGDEEGDSSSDDITELDELDNLREDIRELVIKFNQESELPASCELMESILTSVTTLEVFEEEDAKSLAVCLNFCMAEDLMEPCMLKDKALEDCLEGPFYVICRNICALPTHDVTRERFLTLLSALHTVEDKFGYRFLFYLKASVPDDERLTMYEDFAKTSRGERSLQACLAEDLKVCQAYDHRAFRFLIPSIYRKFSEHVVGNADILHMLVSNMEPRQLNSFISEISLGELVIFGEENEKLDSLLESTLEWESFEQYCVWQLVQAEDVLLESIVGILPQLDAQRHPEALANLLILTKSVRPLVDLLVPVLCMKCSDKRPGNQFSVALLRIWAQEYPRDLAQLLGQQMLKILSGSKKRKTAKNVPTLDQILSHLDWLYRVCQEQENVSFFKHEGFKAALDQVKQASPEARKTKFKMLFAVCEESDSRKRTTRGSRVAATNRPASPSSSEGEEEEESVRPQRAKRRRKARAGMDSDSDD